MRTILYFNVPPDHRDEFLSLAKKEPIVKQVRKLRFSRYDIKVVATGTSSEIDLLQNRLLIHGHATYSWQDYSWPRGLCYIIAVGLLIIFSSIIVIIVL